MRVVFMGTPRAAVPSLERLIADGHEVAAVYTQPDKPAGRGKRISMSAVKEAALAHGLKVSQPVKIRSDEAIEEFRAHAADVVIVVAYGRVLPEPYLSAFPHGAINVHFSLLPKYRGAAPVNWAIVNGETETGVTTMKMDAGLDTGDILLQSKSPIRPGENAIELMDRLALEGAELLSKTLGSLGTITPVPQDDLEATLAPVLKKEDGLLSWMLSAREITDRVRGFQPFPTSFTYFQGRRLTIWRCEPVDAEHHLTRVGTVVKAVGDELLVFCGGDSVLQIHELQLEGKKRIAARDFLNGIKIEAGMVLG